MDGNWKVSQIFCYWTEFGNSPKLLGANAVITGISTENAQTLTRIGVDLSGLLTTSDLQSGIDEAEWLLQVARTHRETNSTDLHGQPAVDR